MTLPEPDIPDPKSLHLAIGKAIQAYAQVEANQASIIQDLLKIDFQRAHAIFFSIQNVRSRNELIDTLLELEFKGELRRYWASCGRFLETLSQFRNAVAHWHPHIVIYKTPSGAEFSNALGHPIFGRNFDGLEEPDFPPFLKDCKIIQEHLSSLVSLLKQRPSSLPEKFQQPIAHRNLAVLRPRRKPKAQPRQPQSSQSRGRKVSPAQRRKEAFAKEVRKRR